MSMACVNGVNPCTGCCACQIEPDIVGECAACGDLIYAYEERYNIEGEIIHDDCLREWAEQFRVVE